MMHTTNQYIALNVHELADEITRYLEEHDCAADTLEGVVNWWIARQRLYEERNKVELAMNYLCEKGVVNVRELPDGEILYCAALHKSSELSN